MKAPSTPSTRIVTALAAGFLAIVLAACGGGGGSSDTGGGASATVEKPVITTQPANQSAVVGQSATFSVVATGGATLAYQWKKNGADISGATSSTYTTPATSSADNGAIFLVSVSNSAGTVTSSSATLAVTAAPVAPSISTQPVNQSVVVGQSATFTVSATGGGTIAYQWKKNGTDISGATSSTYTKPATAIGDSGAVFTVVVSNAAGPVTSAEASLTVTATAVAPSITTQPAAQTVDPGKTASFSVEATGTSPLLYQWKLNGKDISDATSSSYTTPAAAMADSGAAYSVVVSNGAGTVTSSPASLTVTEAPVITTQPTAQTVTAGQTATFSVTATGTAPLGYQWKKGGTDISGATSSTYTTDATVVGDSGAVFTVVVSNSAGSTTSSNATLTVSAPVAPSIGTQPAAQSITAGVAATFTVTATGTAPFSYQWKKGSTVIPGATNSSYTTPAMGYAGNGAVYSVVVSNSAGSVTSSSATLTVSKSSTAQSYGYVANASDGLYDKTECVQDNNTGLVWEGKTASGSRAGGNKYTNYDSTTSLQNPLSVVPPTQPQIDASTNSIGYRNSVNAGSGLCGFTDWRLPTKDELLGIRDSNQASVPYINPTWFPNTRAAAYWTSEADASDVALAWAVTFAIGAPNANYRADASNYSLRLVRGGSQ